MKGKMNIYYDDEADYLEIFIGEPGANYGEEVESGITLFKDEKTNEVVGLGIFSFRRRAGKLQDFLEGIASELSYIGEKLTEISKCLKKMSNWSEADEEKYGDKEDEEDDEE